MTTAYAEYAQSIIEQFFSNKWKLNPEFGKLPIKGLNSAIVEAEHRLKYEHRVLDDNGKDLFHRLVSFIKVNIPYMAEEIFEDMYNSRECYWVPHPSLLRLTVPELNALLFNKMVELQEKNRKNNTAYDINRFNNLSLYIKSFFLS